MKNIFKGLGVALVTPFNEDGTIDYDALYRLLHYQESNGVDFFCVLGSTAETPCLSFQEKTDVKNFVVKRNNRKNAVNTTKVKLANFVNESLCAITSKT